MLPTTLVFVGAVLMMWMRPPGVSSAALWLGFTLEMLLAVGTGVWSAP